jgi:hypothetical protein
MARVALDGPLGEVLAVVVARRATRVSGAVCDPCALPSRVAGARQAASVSADGVMGTFSGIIDVP